jgi:hypothetical protein
MLDCIGHKWGRTHMLGLMVDISGRVKAFLDGKERVAALTGNAYVVNLLRIRIKDLSTLS